MTFDTPPDPARTRPLWLAARTLVATVRGEMPVEQLQPGLRVLTRAAGLVRVLTVGTDPGRGPKGPKAVILPPGALGQGLPERELTVIGDQRLLVFGARAGNAGDRFVAAAELAVARHVEENTLIRLELLVEGPVAILANGAWLGSALACDRACARAGADEPA
ncbi:Hint domain-containing protein [Histidinibacterium lentulum]|uniref:Hedgehog/Intein (Hint) domain-containing protein n=1 Tax=Histidinibacterium lentulum TaxID=2480588 RepID=A0A3N2R977_9RHOB|nr:Hint domain-containing protein [Histidinibacterium lentulum]ROU03995.1 hypothetical protein EAT49_00905 [Histidinibacterium lentulum]